MKNLLGIFKTLGINKANGLFITSENLWQKECQFTSRVGRLIKDKLKPDAFFVFDHKPLILFYDTPKEKERIHKALWNSNESPIIIFAYKAIVEIFNGYHYLEEKSSLEQIASNNNINDFNYFEIVSGKTWDKYQSSLKYESRVDFHLLENIKIARKILISKNNVKPNIANALIGKVIFVRYLIDRKVKIGFDKEKYWSNDDFCSVLSNQKLAVKFFKYLEKKFNGDMFYLDDSDYHKIQQDSLNTVISLLNEDDLGNGQKSLFKLYDFSIIPIEFISNVYESFIGERNQAEEGVYYTPLFLVDYILNETIEKYLLDNPKEYNCKVLDPACGSGIFLVETLRKIIERYIYLHPMVKKDSKDFKEMLRQLALDNIFGLDKNLSAIQVAIFSIQLTLLDYQKPSSIETFRFPKLLKTNFFEADFFDIKHEYNDLLKIKEFSFIIGNPPWKGNGMDTLGKQYLKDRKKKEKNKKYSIAVNNGEIAEGFVLRVSDFTKPYTQIALLVRSSILYNLGYNTVRSPFRNYWTEEFYINKVFELAPVRKEVFNKSHDPSIAPTAIIFYKYAHGENTDNTVIEHITLQPSRFFSLFKIFSISRSDIKEIKQKRLKEFDWLWKVLVYGSYLDFNFITKLRNEYITIGELIDNNKFVVSTGIHSRSFTVDPPKNTISIKNLDLIKSDSIQVMFIDYSLKGSIEFDKVDLVKDKRIYTAPMLLVKKGLDTKLLKTSSAISDKNLIFKDGITSIKSVTNNRNLLAKISALFYSNLYSYLAINTFASIGIEREQAQNYNKFSIPFIDCELESFVSNIEKLKKQINQEMKKTLVDEYMIETLNNEVQNNFAEIDNEIFKSLNLDDKEYALIDFALNIVRSIITRDQQSTTELFNQFNFKDEALKAYADIFINRFSKSLDTKKNKFISEIWYSKQVIGMFFRVVPKTGKPNSIAWLNKSKNDLLKTAIRLSSQKITDKLFVQKDLRGFEKDFFYIFKPNEKRLWHKAIGYLDVDEFMDAILKTGRRNYIGE